MKTSTLGRNFIKRFEGLRLTSYQDSASIWTIGYGHIKDVLSHQVITEIEAEEFLMKDLIPGEESINALINTGIFLTQNEFDALSSFTFNLGTRAFKKSTLWKFIFNKQFDLAAEEFLRWDKARVSGKLTTIPGLTTRRKAERQLFLNGIY